MNLLLTCAVCGTELTTALLRAGHERRRHPDWSASEELRSTRRRLSLAEAQRRRRRNNPESTRLSAARYRKGHREELLEANRDWRMSPDGQANQRAKRGQEIAEGKHQARMAVMEAVRQGALIRKPCEVCGATPTEAHHHLGYERQHWLDVQWFCKQHHSDVHHPEAAEARARLEGVA